MRALLADGKGGASMGEFDNLPVRDTFVKIKVHAVALNPTDYKHVFHFTKGGEIVGIDVTGTVEAIGSKVTTKVQIGDRIAGMVHGCNSYSPRDGGFAEYAEIKDGIFAHLPDDWAWTKGATIGGGTTTAGQGLFRSLQLPLPESGTTTSESVLIYGGGTATGCLAIQFAHLAGVRVITLASENQFERLKQLGADVCYDYHQPDVGEQIRRDTRNALMLAFDIITNEGSMAIVAAALADGSKNGVKPRVSLLLPGKTFPRNDVDARVTSGYSIIGETSIKYGNVVAGEPEEYEFGRKLWSVVGKLIQEDKLVTHDVEVRDGGLDNVLGGLKDLEQHKVKNVKLVYPI